MVRVLSAIRPGMTTIDSNAMIMEACAQRAVDEEWPGVWLVDVEAYAEHGFAACLCEREYQRCHHVADDGTVTIDTDAQMDARPWAQRVADILGANLPACPSSADSAVPSSRSETSPSTAS